VELVNGKAQIGNELILVMQIGDLLTPRHSLETMPNSRISEH